MAYRCSDCGHDYLAGEVGSYQGRTYCHDCLEVQTIMTLQDEQAASDPQYSRFLAAFRGPRGPL